MGKIDIFDNGFVTFRKSSVTLHKDPETESKSRALSEFLLKVSPRHIDRERRS